MNTQQTLRFEYRLSPVSAALMVLAVIILSVLVGYIAYTNSEMHLTRGLAPETRPIIYWGMTVLCFGTGIVVVRIALNCFNSFRHVELGPAGTLVPSDIISMTPVAIPYRSISNIRVMHAGKHQFVVISSSLGESRLLSKLFASPNDFTEFLSVLEQRRQE